MTPVAGMAVAARAMDRGLALFPLPAGGRVPAPGWQRRTTLDRAELPHLLADGGNVGVGCRASRVVALDVDDPSGSMKDWPATFTVSTPRGGLHMYFRVPADCTIGSFSGPQSPLGPRIDVRGPGRRSGGYLVGPGSVVGCLPYLVVRDVPVAPLPDRLTGRLGRRWQEAAPPTCHILEAVAEQRPRGRSAVSGEALPRPPGITTGPAVLDRLRERVRGRDTPHRAG